ncbi:MAG: DUF5011 domain-containing protein [Patescibacteria group bacterium]|nr:DUF5011 domain-containing protein [Patescibacteria group bacterium]
MAYWIYREEYDTIFRLIGSYSVSYVVSDLSGNTSTSTRTVNVVDTTDPVITILGDNPIVLYRGDAYVDTGATAIDNVDGVISVQTSGYVDTSQIGTYIITYSVTDSSLNLSTKTRIINVERRPGGGIPVYILNIMNANNQAGQKSDIVNQPQIVNNQVFKYKNDPKVYLLENGVKRWIKDEKTFNNLGYKWSDIKEIDSSFNTYLDGVDIIFVENIFNRELKFGSTGNDVAKLQTLLKKLKYFTYSRITNYYGSYTLNAVKKFQRANKLKVTGTLDKFTRDMLRDL